MSETTRRFTVTLTEGQADAVVAALDLYTRMGLGQLERIAELPREGVLPLFTARPDREGRREAEADTLETLEGLLAQAKACLGYPSTGSLGIGHRDCHISVNRAYEVKKALQQTVAYARAPSPGFKGVQYDGLTVRYTDDPAPEAEEILIVPGITP